MQNVQRNIKQTKKQQQQTSNKSNVKNNNYPLNFRGGTPEKSKASVFFSIFRRSSTTYTFTWTSISTIGKLFHVFNKSYISTTQKELLTGISLVNIYYCIHI